MILVIADVRVGPGIEQETRDLVGTTLDRHVESRVIAVPHGPLSADGDPVRDQPANGWQVPLVDGEVQGDRIASVGPMRDGSSRSITSASP
jgi:hypothetical protein